MSAGIGCTKTGVRSLALHDGGWVGAQSDQAAGGQQRGCGAKGGRSGGGVLGGGAAWEQVPPGAPRRDNGLTRVCGRVHARGGEHRRVSLRGGASAAVSVRGARGSPVPRASPPVELRACVRACVCACVCECVREGSAHMPTPARS